MKLWATRPQRGKYCFVKKPCTFNSDRSFWSCFIFFFLGLFFFPKATQAQSDGPNSATTASNTSFTGSAGSWSNTANALNSDNSYATISLSANGDYSDYLEFTDFGFALGASVIILGIVVEVERFGSNIKDNQVSIVKGGVIGTTDQSLTASWAGSDPNTYETYGSATDLWGESWTASDINAADFGVVISVRKQGGGGSRTANVDHVRITVHYDTPLPVGLLNFSAETQTNQVALSWTTSWEEDNSHFEVQRSSYDLKFSTLGFIAGANYSDSLIHYQYFDKSPPEGRFFYRLVQHDFNGTYSISELVAVDVIQQPALYQIAPTYVAQETYLSIEASDIEGHTLIFYKPSGEQLRSIYPISQKTIIPADYFSHAGTYFYRLFFKGEKVMSGRIIKP